MRKHYYYHLTSKENAAKILKDGLKPMLGENSMLVSEERPAIYLCKRKDLPYWKILLKREVILQVEESDGMQIERIDYGEYSEYLCSTEIPAEKIKRVYIKMDSIQAMKDLCLSYIITFSRCTEIAARHYNYPDQDYGAELEELLDCSLAAALNLDYSVLSRREIKNELINHGDNGCYTFLDTYLDDDVRMYEQLVRYPEDKFAEKRAKLYQYIKKAFKGCLNVNTGGWTG